MRYEMEILWRHNLRVRAAAGVVAVITANILWVMLLPVSLFLSPILPPIVAAIAGRKRLLFGFAANLGWFPIVLLIAIFRFDANGSYLDANLSRREQQQVLGSVVGLGVWQVFSLFRVSSRTLGG